MKKWFRNFACNFLGWHKPDCSQPIWFDGCSEHSKCRYCGKKIMMDSQGNWFTFGGAGNGE